MQTRKDENLPDRMMAIEKWVAVHDAVCAQRYKQILAWIKVGVTIVGISTVGLVSAMWDVIVHLERL